MFPSWKAVLRRLVAFVSCAAVNLCPAQEQQFPQEHCAITPPAGWHRREHPGQPTLLAEFDDAANLRTLRIVFNGSKPTAPMDETSVEWFEEGAKLDGVGDRTSSRFISIAGLPAYERRGSFEVNGRQVSTLSLLIPTLDGTYRLDALAADDEPDNAEVRAALASFHFLRPPALPPPRRHIAYWIGSISFDVLFGAAMLGLTSWAIVTAIRRASRASADDPGLPRRPMTGSWPTVPPPLPPGAAAPPDER